MKTLIFTYIFIFGCMLTLSAKQEHNIKDCVKHPEIVKSNTAVIQDKPKPQTVEKVVKTAKVVNTIPYFSILNFINFFYTKDTLDNLQVM